MWTETNVDRDKCGQRQMWTKTNVDRDKCGQRQMWTQKNVDRDKCGQRLMGTDVINTEVPSKSRQITLYIVHMAKCVL